MPVFQTPEPIVAVIESVGGHVMILAGDRTDTVVDVRARDAGQEADVRAAEQTQVEYADGRLLVQAPRNWFRSLFGRPPAIDVTVELPTGSRVEGKGWADFRSSGRLGESDLSTVGTIRLERTGRLKVHTGAGDIWIGQVDGPLDASTATGKIRVGDIEGPAVAKTANGDISLGTVTGDVRLNTAYGDISVDHALAGVVAKTAYGSVRIGEVVRGAVEVATNFGEVELGIRAGTAAWLDVNSKYGSVTSDLKADEGPGEGDEVVEIRAYNGFGDIVIRRA
jgi:hypothetical protein